MDSFTDLALPKEALDINYLHWIFLLTLDTHGLKFFRKWEWVPWLFSICDCHLSVRMERPLNEHRVPSIRETLSWYKDKLKNGKASEEMFKTEASMASIGLVRGTLTLWWKDLRLLKEECFIPSQGSQRQRGLSNCFYLRWGVLLEGDLPMVFSCWATPGGLPLKMRPSFQPRLWATTDEYHFTHEYLWRESESICIFF